MWLADSATVDPTDTWVQIVQTGGTAGLIAFLVLTVLAFVKGWVVSGWLHRSETSRLEKVIEEKEAENREQRQFLRDQAAPLLDRNARILERIVEASWTKNPPS